MRTAGDRVQLSAVRRPDRRGLGFVADACPEPRQCPARRTIPPHGSCRRLGPDDSASETDAAAFGPVSPLREAGFTIDAVMTPAQALTVLSSRRPSDAQGPMVWLALNRHRAAIAIIDSGRLLYSREFDWRYRPATTVREELLQRYSLVAHLAPEIRHGLDVAGAEHGAAPGGIVTCGDLPELRSLTMPLIEELDIEVETLDTLDGLRPGSERGSRDSHGKSVSLVPGGGCRCQRSTGAAIERPVGLPPPGWWRWWQCC